MSRRGAIIFSLATIAGLLLLSGCSEPPESVKSPSSPSTSPSTQPLEKITKSDDEWKKILTPDQYFILREKGTEPAFHNAYWDNHDKGIYRCAACGLELYKSDDKFDSGTGWPSYTRPVAADRVELVSDADGSRTEVLCARCGGHLGHVFDDGPAPTGKRFCMDSGAMKFDKTK
jgi:peptide-methionine (R)-S-oxide reductase